MSTLYWLTVLGNISLIAAIAAGLFLFGYGVNKTNLIDLQKDCEKLLLYE